MGVDLSGPDLDAAVARKDAPTHWGDSGLMSPPPYSADPGLWGALLEEMLREGDVEFVHLRDGTLRCLWVRGTTAHPEILSPEGISSTNTPGEAVCRCWLAGRGDEG